MKQNTYLNVCIVGTINLKYNSGGDIMYLTNLGDKDNWEFYKDNGNEWRWRRTASNGRIVGASSQGYVNKADCIENAKRNGYKG